MKKVIIGLVLFKAMVLMVAMLGCAEDMKSDAQLMKLQQPVSDFAASWIKEYGESPESIKNYNIVLVRERLNTEILKIEELEKKVEELEVKTDTWGTVLEKMSQKKSYFDAFIDGVNVRCVENDDGTISVVEPD